MLKKLLLLSFIEGAAVMVAELCGAKLLAPIFGSSLYVWASVMGITLAALALGYFYGGYQSTKTALLNKLFFILSLAALFIILMPVLSHYLVPRISYWPFLPAIVISSACLLLPPIFLLGASSPLFIALQSTGNDSGRVSGTVYAVSTVGGIAATFLCGFYLIPVIGLTACLVSFGSCLFLLNVIICKMYKPIQLFLFAGFIYLNLQFSVPASNLLYASDSVLGRLEVLDFAGANKDSIRILRINNIVQTEMNLRTHQSVSEYVKLLDTLVPHSASEKSALVLGLGGGLTANVLASKNYRCKGVEFDERIIYSAKKHFYLNPQVETVYSDARYFLNHCNEKYDLVMVDVFKAEEQPSHVLTMESLGNLKQNLNDSALVIINWHGYISGNKGLGTSILYSTLKASGFRVQLCSTGGDENYRNILFVASLRQLREMPYQLTSEKPEQLTLLNTDNMPLLEKYNSEANKTWRVNYLKYYQNKK